MYYIYIITNTHNTTLYIGITGDLIKRITEHKDGVVKGFSKKYNLHKLVYFEATEDATSAITREKQLKKWNRAWKDRIITEMNPEWKDLYPELF